MLALRRNWEYERVLIQVVLSFYNMGSFIYTASSAKNVRCFGAGESGGGGKSMREGGSCPI